MKRQDKLDQKKAEDALRREASSREVAEEISRMNEESERASVKSKIYRRGLIDSGPVSDEGWSGTSGAPGRRPASDRRPVGLLDTFIEGIVQSDLERVMHGKGRQTDLTKVKARLDGSPGSFKWLFRGLEGFDKERIVDEFKELEDARDKTAERLYLEIKDGVFGLSRVEAKRLEYIKSHPGEGLLGFERTRHAILEEQLRRTVGPRGGVELPWMPKSISYTSEVGRIKRLIKFLEGGEDFVPDSRKDEVLDDAVKILGQAASRKLLNESSGRGMKDILGRYRSSKSSVSLPEVRPALLEYFGGQIGPGFANPESYASASYSPSENQYTFITQWDLMDSKSRALYNYHRDNYLLRLQTALMGKYLPKKTKLWWARKAVKGKIESLFDDINEEIYMENVFRAKVAKGHKLVEDLEEELRGYDRFTTEEEIKIKKIFEAQIKELAEYEKVQEAY